MTSRHGQKYWQVTYILCMCKFSASVVVALIVIVTQLLCE